MCTTLVSCPTCPFEARTVCVLDAHKIDMHGIAPDRAPRLGDPVYVADDYRFFVVGTARKACRCAGCGVAIGRGQLNASHPYSYAHYCVPHCANFEFGVVYAEAFAHTLAKLQEKLTGGEAPVHAA